MAEAHDAELGPLGERLEVVGLGAAGGQVRGDVVVALDEPAEAAGAEVLPGRPQLERPEPAGPLEAQLVEVQLAGVGVGGVGVVAVRVSPAPTAASPPR